MKPFCQLTGTTAPAHVSKDHAVPPRKGVRQLEGARTEPQSTPTAQSQQFATIHSAKARVGAKGRSNQSEGKDQTSKRQSARKQGGLQQVNADRENGVGGSSHQAGRKKIPSRSQQRPRPMVNSDTDSDQGRAGRAEETPLGKRQEDVKSPTRDGIIAFSVCNLNFGPYLGSNCCCRCPIFILSSTKVALRCENSLIKRSP